MTTKAKVIAGIVVVLLVAVAAFAVGFTHPGKPASSASTTKLGSQVQAEPFWFSNGIQFGSNGQLVNWTPPFTMSTGVNQAAWLNNTGVTVYVTSVSANCIMTTGASSTVTTASTSMYLWMGTSTTATVTNPAVGTQPFLGSVLDKVLIATSSAVGTIHDGITLSAFSGSNEQGMVPVANGQYLIAAIMPVNASPIGETATSTARGFNLQCQAPYWHQ